MCLRKQILHFSLFAFHFFLVPLHPLLRVKSMKFSKIKQLKSKKIKDYGNKNQIAARRP